MAERLKHALFTKGDILTRQGAVAHWLYILTEGEAEVALESESGRQSLSTIQAGGFFGEMGLLTGEPRSATVLAKTDVECYQLDKASLEDIIRSRPSMAEEISRILALRQSELHLAQNGIAEAERTQVQSRSDILNKIRGFFGLDTAM